MDINLEELLNSYRSHPFEDHDVETPHCGTISLKAEEGQSVEGPGGQWMQQPGTLLFSLEREKNLKKICSPCNGNVHNIRKELDTCFVQAGEKVLCIRHRLDKEEVIDRILTEVLSVLKAPQTARYMLMPDIAARLEKEEGRHGVSLDEGDEALIMSLMKRDTIITYSGVPGIIFRVYFQQGDLVEQGEPMIGVCPPDKIEYVNRVIAKIRNEWGS